MMRRVATYQLTNHLSISKFLPLDVLGFDPNLIGVKGALFDIFKIIHG